jgi:hypothetical protein
MARYVWILFAVLLAGFVLLVRLAGHDAPIAATAGRDGGGGGGVAACRSPPTLGGPRPLQSPVPGGIAPIRVDRYTLTPLAGFAIEARVLGREDYTFDNEAAVSPTDLALGWDRMADPAVYGALQISQGGRWYRYFWQAGGPPIPLGEIIASSANMHMIPADDGVAAAIARIRPEQTVQLRGWLVEVRRDDGWTWRSSLSRDDSGDGSCEIVYVCSVSGG